MAKIAFASVIVLDTSKINKNTTGQINSLPIIYKSGPLIRLLFLYVQVCKT